MFGSNEAVMVVGAVIRRISCEVHGLLPEA